MKGGEASFQWGNNEKEVHCAERIYKNNFECTREGNSSIMNVAFFFSEILG